MSRVDDTQTAFTAVSLVYFLWPNVSHSPARSTFLKYTSPSRFESPSLKIDVSRAGL